ncbi:hypothetical protein ACIBFB_17690 [Nocardiopsis sp. NPDC050513]|uniref:hypothetical protein n=1 Tax=Nocardiopsis sp. NPDC050513 TaxID=3364338 RepID=UPI0037A33221
MRELRKLHGSTEMFVQALARELDSQVQFATDLYTRGLEAATEGGRDVEAQLLFTRAQRSAEEVLIAIERPGMERFPALRVEAGLIAGRSELQRGQYRHASTNLLDARANMLEALPADDDLFLKVGAVEADLRRAKSALVAQSANASLEDSIQLLSVAVRIEATLPGADPRLLQDLRLQLLDRRLEFLATSPEEPFTRYQRIDALRTALDLLTERPLDAADPELRATAYTYARLLRQEIAEGAQFSESVAARVTTNMRAVVTYLERGDRDGVPGLDTRDALLALRDIARVHAGTLAPGGPGWDERSMAQKRAAVRQRVELLEEALASGAKAPPEDRERRVADSFDLFSALAEAGPERWTAARQEHASLPTRLAEIFGASDERVGRAAESLAAMEFSHGRDELEAGRTESALGSFKRAISHQRQALGNLLARGAATVEGEGTLKAMLRARGQAATRAAGVRPAPTIADALRAKRQAAGRGEGGDVSSAVAAGRGPSPRTSPAARLARTTIRRALRGT